MILASYLASWLMAGAILAVGACISAMTKNQVIAFVVTAALVFVLTVGGLADRARAYFRAGRRNG